MSKKRLFSLILFLFLVAGCATPSGDGNPIGSERLTPTTPSPAGEISAADATAVPVEAGDVAAPIEDAGTPIPSTAAATEDVPNYAATATVAYPEDLAAKIEKALTYQGTKFIHILTPCPSGWKFDSALTIKLARLAGDTCLFPLYEIIDGREYILSRRPCSTQRIREYFALQGRFADLTEEDLARVEDDVWRRWDQLLFLAGE